MLIIDLVSWLKFIIIILIIYCLFRFIYSIYLFIFINPGKIYIRFKINNGLLIECFISIIHWIPLNLLMFLKLYFI